VINSKADLNPKDLSVIVVSDVLNDQERHHEQGYSGSDEERDASAPDISSVTGNSANKQINSDG
jgi:hypothetical protein